MRARVHNLVLLKEWPENVIRIAVFNPKAKVWLK
jgi:hypothetical protein